MRAMYKLYQWKRKLDILLLSRILFKSLLLLVLLQIIGAQNNMGPEFWLSMFGGLGAGGLTVPSSAEGTILSLAIFNKLLKTCEAFHRNDTDILVPFPPRSKKTTAPAEEVYATQMSQLREMGFFDTEENIRALRATSGNVHAAVERLLGNNG